MNATNPQILSPTAASRRQPALRLASMLRRLARYLGRGVSIDSVCLLTVAVLCELPAHQLSIGGALMASTRRSSESNVGAAPAQGSYQSSAVHAGRRKATTTAPPSTVQSRW